MDDIVTSKDLDYNIGQLNLSVQDDMMIAPLNDDTTVEQGGLIEFNGIAVSLENNVGFGNPTVPEGDGIPLATDDLAPDQAGMILEQVNRMQEKGGECFDIIF